MNVLNAIHNGLKPVGYERLIDLPHEARQLENVLPMSPNGRYPCVRSAREMPLIFRLQRAEPPRKSKLKKKMLISETHFKKLQKNEVTPILANS
jgi:hypothetical protein